MRRAAVVVSIVLVSILAACSFTPGGAVDAAGGGDDASAIDVAPDAPAIDGAIDARVDAAIDAAVDAPIDGALCTPGCEGADQITCPSGPTGPPTRTPCDLGCFPLLTPHCGVVVPSNLTGIQTTTLLSMVTGGLTFAANEIYLLDTDTGEITFDDANGTQVFRAAGAGGRRRARRVRRQHAHDP